ncbi:MAG: hypothetical protein WAT71_10650 [Ignavibacteria bacterium]
MIILRIDIIEIAIELLSDKTIKNKLRNSQIEKKLKYKNPLLYSNVSRQKIKSEFIKIFPIHNNKKKRTKIFKISKKQLTKAIRYYSYTIGKK